MPMPSHPSMQQGAKRFGSRRWKAQTWRRISKNRTAAVQESTPLLRAANITPETFWQPAVRRGTAGWLPASHDLITRLVFALVPLMLKPPPAPITVAARPEPLRMPTCADRSLWRGRRVVPARIIDIVMFAWELDMLEIRLFELEGVVESHVVWEGAYSQRGTQKPLLLSASMARFERFRDRMLYRAQDDEAFRESLGAAANARVSRQLLEPWRSLIYNGTQAHSARAGSMDANEDHRMESARAWLRMERLRLAHGAPAREGEVLFVFSDLDEIPNARVLQALKHCEPLEEWQGHKVGQMIRVPPLRLGFGIFMHDLEHGCCMHAPLPYNIVVLPTSESGPAGKTRYTGYPKPPDSLGLGAHLSRCVPPAQFMLKSWLQFDTDEFRTDVEQRKALDLRGWYEHCRNAWQSTQSIRRVQRLTSDGQELTSTWDPATHKFPKPWTPWFPEANKARFPYMFPSLFPEWMPYYLL